MSDGDKILAWIRDWLTDGGAILMIADYDGTLSPFVREPSQAWLGRRPMTPLLATPAGAPLHHLGTRSGGSRTRVGA
jgi:hypothetical protein